MTAPSKLRAAQAAPDRAMRVRKMAEAMRHHEAGPEAGCTFHHLRCAGFTPAEIDAYRDQACEMLSARPPVALAPSAARVEGKRLVRAARAVRKRVEARQAS